LLIELPLTVAARAECQRFRDGSVKGVGRREPTRPIAAGRLIWREEPVPSGAVTGTPRRSWPGPATTLTLDVRALGPDGEPVEAEVASA